jgi:transposase
MTRYKNEPPKRRKYIGRPFTSVLTPIIQKKVVDALIEGMPIRFIAAYAGIDRQTFFNWLDRGASAAKVIREGGEVPDEEMPYVAFSQAVEVAISEHVAYNLARIKLAAKGIVGQKTLEDGSTVPFVLVRPEWQAAAWILERKYPDEFGRKDRVAATIEMADTSLLDAIKSKAKDAFADEVDPMENAKP